ncbi:MAG: hypothetical protein SFY69_03050 [Planctomycetota bacterium]|nr:hypothetical protein [Planctomycetota bacterium]
MNPTFADLPDAPARAGESECDALADLFLHPAPAVPLRLVNDEAPAPARQRPAPEPAPLHIEGLVLGHLPVLGAAWVTQYAKSQADAAHAPVALLRVQGGQTRLDLVMPRGSEARVSSRIGGAHSPAGTTLAQAVDAAASQCARWVLRVDETGEADFALTPGIDSLTVLCGADDPAVVSTYRTIKNFVDLADSREHAPTFRLGLMGADDERAAVAEQKVALATSVFLSRPIETGCRVAKVGACTTQLLFRADETHDVATLVGMITGADARRRAAAAVPARAADAPAGAPPLAPASAPSATLASPAPPAPETAHASPGRTGTASHARAADATAPESAVLEHLGIAPLSTACPAAPGVWLACDQTGVLHLVAQGQASHEAGVRGLLAAAAWADAHAPLLEAAHAGSLRDVRSRGATLHLITTDARACRPLLDTGVRVHLATRAPHGAWVFAPLN